MKQLRFSDRIGVTKPVTEIQVKSLSKSLRISLWNFFHVLIEKDFYNALRCLALEFLKIPIDDVPRGAGECQRLLRVWFEDAQWFDVYNVVEHVLDNIDKYIPDPRQRILVMLDDPIARLNALLENEASGYRFLDGTFVPIVSEQELGAIEDAGRHDSLSGASEHIGGSSPV